ncbi:4-diphosphocytidyl-2C-methyl-D-erythritol kinase [Actibacterium mucosum KCTC 23349]|uniref:4-diphosphocytidyl-2-C-methyl-D-erythritol kinase n=1 Tax=Actibacterium mucosum KCTC 23349 TaxID=1454373 RepID=A0A037ZKE8_9RHOB|nr:4-(cytidine 5'-diphospho)-2-C-methyl-D-erythritol kinase [Actibacterium mucosum]KAJ56114.1 4-diphosphocytidyl-2C-methyl-D-erythritol kinase [Actibacterium mucosum KCTC 23349]
MAIEAFAPAKINLTLHVTGQRADGYHLLDSLVMFADVGDTVGLVEGQGLSLRVTGPAAEGVPTGPENSILKAAGFAGQTDLAFSLNKVLPSAAGIGGGTSDAAAALRAISALRGVSLPPDTLPLGADVPVCMLGTAARMRGVGGQVTPVQGLPRLHAVLVNPRISVPTPSVFKALTDKNNPPMLKTLPALKTATDFAAWLSEQRNDLQAPAIAAAPVIADVLGVLRAQTGRLLTRMSGSGATCFALFETEEAARVAALKIQRSHPQWWVAPCQLS